MIWATFHENEMHFFRCVDVDERFHIQTEKNVFIFIGTSLDNKQILSQLGVWNSANVHVYTFVCV